MDEKNIKAVENLVVEGRRITIQEIAEILGISSDTVHLHMTRRLLNMGPTFANASS